MGVRFIVLAVVLSAVDANTTFGSPLSESVSREAARLVAAPAGQAHASKRTVWTGVAVAVTGVALAKLAFHEANSTYCPGSTVRGCTGCGCPPRICLRPHSDLRYDACAG